MSEKKSSKQTCLYCGNNPVNHKLTYFFEWLSTKLSPMDHTTTNSWFGKTAMYLMLRLEKFFLWTFTHVGIARWSTDIEKIALPRGKVMFEEAVRRGIPIKYLIIYGKSIDTYKAQVNGKMMIFQGLPRKEKEIQTTWIDDKAILKQKLHDAGVPVPQGASFKNKRDALRAFDTLRKPLIAKPRSGSRGRHTTTMIHTPDELEEAWRIARMISPDIVVEEHLFGSVYRGTVVGGELVGILGGDPARVTGDGVSTVHELIEKKNASRPSVIHEYKITKLTDAFLKRSGYTLESIIPSGTTIDLSEKIGTSYGGTSTELFDTAHPKIKEYLKKAGDVVNDNLVGFDFIIPDPTADPDTQKWGIIECNTLPFINLHHDPVNGTPRNVAKYVWDLWEK